jgi:hypothetical protein
MWNPFRKKVVPQPEIPEVLEPESPFFAAIKQGTANGAISWQHHFNNPEIYPRHFIAHRIGGGLSYTSMRKVAAERWELAIHSNMFFFIDPDVTILFREEGEQDFLSAVRMQAAAAAQEEEVSAIATKAAHDEALLNSLMGIVAEPQAAPSPVEVEQESLPCTHEEMAEEMTTGPLVDDGKFDW